MVVFDASALRARMAAEHKNKIDECFFAAPKCIQTRRDFLLLTGNLLKSLFTGAIIVATFGIQYLILSSRLGRTYFP